MATHLRSSLISKIYCSFFLYKILNFAVDVLNFLFESFELGYVILLLCRVIFEAVLSKLTDLQAIVLY